MHFEKSQSAIHIAQALDVNKNTINEDIKYWYSELAAEFESLDVKNLLLKQHQRMESQRERLVQLLEKQQDIHTILKIERMLYELDRTIAKIILPIVSAQKPQDIPEEIVTQTAEHLLVNDEIGKITGYSDVELLKDIIQYRKCDVPYAQKILDRIKGLGLGLFKNQKFIMENVSYDMLGFAEARNILSDEKMQTVYSKIEQREEQQKREIAELELNDKEIEKQFVEKYGDRSNWVPEIWAKYYHEIGLV